VDRILVIRGGAIGDFILTLPALKALRDCMPHCHIEILGYKHIAVLAENRFYAQAALSIEYAPLAKFFAIDAELPGELAEHFASFDLIISYLYDPDRIFEANLRRCGCENLICGPAKIVENAGHAACQLGSPIQELGIEVADLSERIFPSDADRQFAHKFLSRLPQPIVAIHPGSGSPRKNWPIENWIAAMSEGEAFSSFGKRPSLVVIAGEADTAETERLEYEWRHRNVCFAKNLPLPGLSGVLANSTFIGHDSGISHLAAAAGADCILLFGPTEPAVWAPKNDNVRVLRAPGGRLCDLEIAKVHAALTSVLSSR
jgi:heptosyltransferase-2